MSTPRLCKHHRVTRVSDSHAQEDHEHGRRSTSHSSGSSSYVLSIANASNKHAHTGMTGSEQSHSHNPLAFTNPLACTCQGVQMVGKVYTTQ
jgi:hypothetical protein